MAVTSAPVSASASVSDPRPAPTSTTRSPGPTPARAAMRRTVLASATKFWPSARLGARSCSASRLRTWRGLNVTRARYGELALPLLTRDGRVSRGRRQVLAHLLGSVAEGPEHLLEDEVGTAFLDLGAVGEE